MYYNDDYYDGYESMDEEWDRLQREAAEEIAWKIENRISDEDLEEGPILYDAITGRPIYRNGGCYDPRYDD